MSGVDGRTRDLPHRRRVTLVEVGPRDGLQNESSMLPASRKAEFVRRVVSAGADGQRTPTTAASAAASGSSLSGPMP